MFIVQRNADSWRQVAEVIAREAPRLDVDLVVMAAASDEIMAAFSFDGARTAYVFDNEEQRQAYSERYPDELCIGKPRKTPPQAPASPYPLELLKVSSELLAPGLKECLRIGRKARLNELTRHGHAIICVGGENGRIDTAAVLVPGLRADHADAHIVETLCAPYEQ